MHATRTMKKIFLAALGLFALGSAGAAQAATISLTPSASTVTAGQTFTVLMSVDPAGESVSTVKSVLSYPADLLTPTSFTYQSDSPTWIPLAQAGYDSMGSGEIIKTAGFPGGLTAKKVFGTITFVAKGSGSATVGISDKSLAYDTQNNNVLSGAQGAVTITVRAPAAPAPAPVQASAMQPAPVQTAVKPLAAEPGPATVSAEEASTSLTAAVVLAVPDQDNFSAWGWIALAAGAGIALTLGWTVFRRYVRP